MHTIQKYKSTKGGRGQQPIYVYLQFCNRNVDVTCICKFVQSWMKGNCFLQQQDNCFSSQGKLHFVWNINAKCTMRGFFIWEQNIEGLHPLLPTFPASRTWWSSQQQGSQTSAAEQVLGFGACCPSGWQQAIPATSHRCGINPVFWTSLWIGHGAQHCECFWEQRP